MRIGCLNTIFLIASLNAVGQSLSPPQLLCATNELSGDVSLVWSIPDNPCGPFLGYEIYASELREGPYALLASIAAEATTDFLHSGAGGITTTWYYYMVPQYDCPGFDAPSSDTLDNRDPEPPVIDFVSVENGAVELNWLPSPSPETTGYIIYRQVLGFTPVDTVYGRFNTTYIDVTAAVSEQSETYSIAAVDSCRTLGLFANPAHNTILLQTVPDPCGSLRLEWNFYAEWPSGIASHEIRVSIDDGPETTVESLGPGVRSYELAVNDTDSVCVRVRALREDGVFSNSNQVCRVIAKVQPSRFVYLRNASMEGEQTARIEWYVDPTADAETWRLERGESPGPWTVRASEPLIPPVLDFITYRDEPVQAGRYYRAQTQDSCGVFVPSEAGRTIRLRGEAGFGLSNMLTWNPFLLPNSTIVGYEVYRLDAGLWTLMASLGPTALSYSDDVSGLLDGDGIFCYRVEAMFDLDLPELNVLERLVSQSNEVCVEQIGKVFVPNAIVPGGSNPIFKPVILFGQADSYTLQVISRYGGVVFESNDPERGWDGTIDGQAAPGGSYGYVLRFTAVNGQDIVKKGNVTVVR